MIYLTRDRALRKKRLEVIRNSKVFTNAVLMISVGHPSIRVDVETFIRNNEEMKATEIGKNIFELSHKDKVMDESAVDTTYEILKRVREIEEQLKEQGVQRLHLLYAGPSMVAAMIGAELANRFIVLCYQRFSQANGKENYVLWGELQP